MIDREVPEWMHTAYWLLAATYAAGFLLLVLVFGVGLVLGPDAPDEPPSVDFDGAPTDVVANATVHLHHTDYVADFRVRTRNFTTGNSSDVRYVRATFENSASRLLVRTWPSAFRGERPDASEPPHRVWVNRYDVAWVSLSSEPGWQHSSDHIGYDRGPIDPFRRYDVDDRNATVRANNDTHYVVVGRDPARVTERDFEAFRVTVVIAKQPEPHLVEYTATREYPQSITRNTVRISRYGNASAPRPKRVPSTTIEELVWRAAAGIDRLF